MTDAAPAVFVALEASAVGAAIRQSAWLYMTANVGHIVSLVVFAGAVAIMDVRMTGALAATSPGYILKTARRFAIAAFVGLLLTGAILFTAEASHVITNPVFQFKLALIGLALLNITWFEYFTAPKVRTLAPLTPLPSAARMAGFTSIGLWIAVAAAGRTIAYL